MHIVQIVRNPARIDDSEFKRFLEQFPTEVAKILSCKESGDLRAEDIAVEVTEFGPFARNCRDIHVRVLAHDYPSHRGNNLIELDIIRLKIEGRVWPFFPSKSWIVMVQLAPTSFCSDDIMRRRD